MFLLRGINVGGSGKLAMVDLRAAAEGLGMTDVRTYIQSGNLVARWDRDPEAAGAELAIALRGLLDPPPAVLVRTGEQLRRTVEASPFRDVDDPSTVHFVFLDTDAADALAGFDAEPFAPEEVVPVGRELHLHLPGGMGRSRLATALTRSGGAAEGTARGWRTVTRLADMASEVD